MEKPKIGRKPLPERLRRVQISLTLSRATVDKIGAETGRAGSVYEGNASRFVDDAVRDYSATTGAPVKV